ncbi:MAG: sulfate adenylyltransferase [Trueperaceae bacterium]|nr:sulfate adenylyltransferase [Trueperaceae bacterium]
MPTSLITPHGGTLVDRVLRGAERQRAFENAHALPRLTLSERALADLECIATGIYSPLEGFVGEADYQTIVDTMHLQSGAAWSIPVTLQVPEEGSEKYRPDHDVALAHPNGDILAVLTVTDKYRPDQAAEADKVYGTSDEAHPGVAAMLEAGPVYLGGPIALVADIPHTEFGAQRLTPAQTRAAFEEKGWRTVVAFQTRNPIHRAHEYLTKVALEIVDGLLINPLVGATKADDIPADVRMRCYDVLMEHYYPHDRVILGVFPAAMRYAGPREAVMHAIARQNYGCTHFIVGRDHAGVGSYYGTYDAQKIFETFSDDALAIEIMRFEHSFYCTVCESMASTKTCPHDKEHHIFLSGTKVREMLSQGEMPPAAFSRPEVAKILIDAYSGKATA